MFLDDAAFEIEDISNETTVPNKTFSMNQGRHQAGKTFKISNNYFGIFINFKS